MKECNYVIHIPSNDGYPDIIGFYHECDECGFNYVDIEQSEEWDYCPGCGKMIKSKETYECETCQHAECEDGDCYCENDKGKHYGDCINNMCFDGCEVYQEKISKEEAWEK